MRRFWIHLKLYVHHLRRGNIPKRWPPRLIELPRGKRLPRHLRPDPRVDQLWGGHQFGNDGECERCGVTHEEWFWSPEPLPCP